MAVLFGSIGLAIVTVRPFVKAKNKFKVYECQVEVTDWPQRHLRCNL